MRRLLGPIATLAASLTLLGLISAPALASHVRCGDVITEDTTLDADLIDCPGDGIVIGADNITLDLDGHTIDGTSADDSDGIRNSGTEPDPACGGCTRGYEGVTVENGTIREFGDGIVVDHGGLAMLRLTVTENTEGGVDLYRGEGELLDSDISDNLGNGVIGVYLGNGVRVERNRIANNGGEGLYLDEVRHPSVVKGNRITGNLRGATIVYSTRHTIEGNVVAENGTGLGLTHLSSSVVARNHVNANHGDGITGGYGFGGNLLERNDVRGNTGNGIHLTACSSSCPSVYNNRLLDNRVTDNDENGVLLDDSDPHAEADLDTVFVGNNISGNGGDGIAVTARSFGGSQFEGNVLSRNADDGIDIDPIYRRFRFLSPLSWSPDGSRLAFASDLDSAPDSYSSDVYTAKPDGSDRRRLTTGGGGDPAWSPDGSRIAFTSPDNGLYTIHPDGTGLRRIADRQYSFYGGYTDVAWSPDGMELAFGRTTGQQADDLIVVNADGSGLTRLTSGRAPVWSPDGSKIAFLDEIGTFPNSHTALFVIDGDGSNRLLLSRPGNPSWSPDGTKLAFALDDGVHTINADGTGATRITDNPNGFDRSPAWSPDGAKIAFMSLPCGEESETCPGIFTVDPDGSNLARVTSIPGAPVWSADGSRIAFVSDGAYTINPDGTGLLELKIDPLLINDPSTLSSNRADRNGDLGIEAVPGTLGGGNRAKHNGNPAQCDPASLCDTRGRPKAKTR